MKQQTESEFMTRMHFRLAYYRAKLNGRIRSLRKVMNHFPDARNMITLIPAED